MEKINFRVGDTVNCGLNGGKGKIVDIIHPLGTYAMYKVQLFNDGQILTLAKHELVKGFSDDLMMLNSDMYSQFIIPNNGNSNATIQPESTCIDGLFESSILDTLDSSELDNLLFDISSPPPEKINKTALLNQIPSTTSTTETGSKMPIISKTLQSNRFAPPVEIEDYIKENENEQTRRKTLSHQRLLESYLVDENENRKIHEIPANELNLYLCQFIVSVRQKNGDEYEPVTLRSMISSFERYLKRHNYGISLVNGYEFGKLREVLKCKQKDLKKQGRGNKPKAADTINDDEIELLYTSGQLGTSSPAALINTLWLNNTLHFGMRGGGSEHRQLCWGDITLCFDSDLGKEYLQFNERQTKTRTGEDIHSIRKTHPRMYATNIVGRCPIEVYKKYAEKRPSTMKSNESPFYLSVVTNNDNPTYNERWFLSQPIGVNKLNRLLKSMAEKANLPDLQFKRLSNTSVRKHLCQKLLDSNVPDTHAVHVTGHKNPQSLNNYRTLSNRQQHSMSRILSTTRPDKENITRPNEIAHVQQISQTCSQSLEVESSMNIDTNLAMRSVFSHSNIYGGTFNINLHIEQPKRQRLE